MSQALESFGVGRFQFQLCFLSVLLGGFVFFLKSFDIAHGM